MDGQSKLDLVAGSAILLMLVGAYALTVTFLGLFLIAVGIVVMLFLFLKILQTR